MYRVTPSGRSFIRRPFALTVLVLLACTTAFGIADQSAPPGQAPPPPPPPPLGPVLTVLPPLPMPPSAVRPPGIGVIAGRVVDANRRPVVNTEVRAMRRVQRFPGEFLLVGGARATTDSQGGYSFTALDPGDYVVVVPRGPLPSTVQRDGSKLGYVTTYFPGVSSRDEARPLTVRQNRISDIDFALQRTTVVDVKGIVIGGRASGPVRLSPEDDVEGFAGTDTRSQIAGAGGAFVFPDVTPGGYFLEVVNLTALGRVRVDITPIFRDTVLLALEPNVTVSGRVEFRGGDPTAEELAELQVMLDPDRSPGSPFRELRRGPVGPDGRFTIENVQRGRYRMFPSNLPPRWARAVGLIGGIDTTFAPVEITADVTNAVLALRLR